MDGNYINDYEQPIFYNFDINVIIPILDEQPSGVFLNEIEIINRNQTRIVINGVSDYPVIIRFIPN